MSTHHQGYAKSLCSLLPSSELFFVNRLGRWSCTLPTVILRWLCCGCLDAESCSARSKLLSVLCRRMASSTTSMSGAMYTYLTKSSLLCLPVCCGLPALLGRGRLGFNKRNIETSSPCFTLLRLRVFLSRCCGCRFCNRRRRRSCVRLGMARCQ